MELSLRRGWTFIQPSFYVYESVVKEGKQGKIFLNSYNLFNI